MKYKKWIKKLYNKIMLKIHLVYTHLYKKYQEQELQIILVYQVQ